MSNFKDLTGSKFNNLTVLYRDTITPTNRVRWFCRCDCGVVKSIMGKHIVSGKITSCGCNHLSSITKHGRSNTRLYNIFKGMKERCFNPNFKEYEHYGGKGVTICNEWLEDFNNFYYWATHNGYKDTLTIDRINTDGDYCPENCRWVTYKEQNNNTSRNRFITIDNKTHTISEWSTILGINYSTIISRLRRGWSDEEALKGRSK